MARYIDADFVRSAKLPYDEELSEYERGWNAACDAIAADAPTADVVERKTGKWVKENIVLTSNPPQYMWHCSVCGKLMHWFNDSVLTSFCPNCGAEMDERREE